MKDVPPQPLFYLQDSTQIEKSPDETTVSARCLISQSVAGGWRRPLPLTQHLSPLRSEHLSFLFVLSYYYYQGNFQLSSSTRQQPAGVSRHFSDCGWSGRGRGRGRGDPTSDSIYQLSCFSQLATYWGLFSSRSAPFSFFFFPSTASGFGETPPTAEKRQRGHPPLRARRGLQPARESQRCSISQSIKSLCSLASALFKQPAALS